MASSIFPQLRKVISAFTSNRTAGLDAIESFNSLDWDAEGRAEQYHRNESLLNNTYYLAESLGGYKEEVLRNVFAIDIEDVRLSGVFAPVRTIVDAYQNIFRGKWGREIRVDPKVGGESGKNVNPALTVKGLDVVGRIWRESNLDTRKEALQQMASNLGTVGIRVVARPSADPGQRRASLQFDHPKTIFGFNEDDRGNATEVELEYDVKVGPIRDRKVVKCKEVLSKTRILKEIDGSTVFDSPNALNVCPYTILRHKDENGEQGGWAYRGSEPIIHALNLLFSNMGESISEHVWPTWFGTAGGEDPATIETGRHRMVYVRSDPDTPNPSLEPLVARLDWQGAMNYGLSLIDHLVSRNPELLFSHIKALSGQSGETIAKLQIAGIDAIQRAKGNYEDSIGRAIKIAMSYGVLYDMWDLGAGTGNVSSAEASFRDGLEDFEFADRPALPESVYEQLQRAKLEQAQALSKAEVADKVSGIVSNKQQLRILGFTESEATSIQDERVDEEGMFNTGADVTPNNPGGQNGGPDTSII